MTSIIIRLALSLAVIAIAAVMWHEGVAPVAHTFFNPIDALGTTVMIGAVGIIANVMLCFMVVIALIIIWVEQ